MTQGDKHGTARNDRRIQRTRRMLREALIELVIRDLEDSARGSEGDHLEAEGLLVFRHVEAKQNWMSIGS